MLRKIISGGQTAADRAGLDFAIEVGLEHEGFVPRGRRAEDGRISKQYHLTELYAVRTKRNIREGDGAVVFSLDPILNGGFYRVEANRSAQRRGSERIQPTWRVCLALKMLRQYWESR